jgi:(1->4)-alpha-D-glucan 1-alpha-D-glucosylmutase
MSARISSATYRLQTNGDFRFFDAAAIVKYLHQLGISDCYTSPIVQARAGSRHCCDVTDHGRLNPEIGGLDGFHEFARQAQRLSMGMIVDTVPSHMCVAGHALVRNNFLLTGHLRNYLLAFLFVADGNHDVIKL